MNSPQAAGAALHPAHCRVSSKNHTNKTVGSERRLPCILGCANAPQEQKVIGYDATEEDLYKELKQGFARFGYRLRKSQKKDAAMLGEPYELCDPDGEIMAAGRLSHMKRTLHDFCNS